MVEPGVFRFNDVIVDVGSRLVRRDGEPVHLEPQAFDLLVTLIRERVRVVPKTELLERVWGDQFVSESALTTRIKEIRRAVGDDGTRQEVVKNVRGRGYRFLVEVVDGPGLRASLVAPGAGRLVGRDGLVARASEMLDRVGVLTLVGPGGVGKTSIAELLAAAGRGSPDGSIVVRLAAIEDAGAVVPAVRSAAGLTDATSADEVATTLAGLDGLLLLDNCEHVLGAVAELAERIVGVVGARALRVVATSRERLGVPGEQVLPVDILTRDAARALFVERARAAKADFVPPADARLLDRILEMLDHLPLAIEMAAARVSAIGLRDLHDLISDELSVLDSPHRAAAERHRTLDDLVRWSERLLDDGGRRALVDFSAFAGSVGTDDVSGVLGGGDRPRALASVAKLVDRSLVVAHLDDEPPTYSMLSTIRDYAARQRPADVDRRHAHWFTRVAEEANRQLRTVGEAAADARLGAIIDELRAAHRWARAEEPSLAARLTGALDHYAHTRHWPEPADWAAELEPLLEDRSPELAKVRAALAAEAAHRGDYRRAVALAEAAIESDDPFVRVSAGETLSDVALFEGDLVVTVEASKRVVEVGEEGGDPCAKVLGITGLTLAATYRGDHAAGLALLDELRGVDLSPSGRAWLAYCEGECLAATDPPRALQRYGEAIELGASVNNRLVVGVARVSRLALQARSGDPDDALAEFEPVLRTYRRTGNASHSVTALRNLIDLLARTGDDEVAMRLLGALSSRALKATYGEESERLAAAREAAESRHGADAVAAWMAAMAGRGHRWALDTAIDHLAARTGR